MTAELKPCPFCGGDKNTICKTDYDGRDSYAVSCRYPECHGAIFTLGYGYFADEAEAIAAWNTRAMPAINPAAIREAALREAMDACTYVIKNIDILKADGETYETPRIQKIARGLVDVARQQIEALIGEKK